MQILHIVGRLGYGGAEKLVVDLALRQRREGDIVNVAVVSRPVGPPADLAIWKSRIAELQSVGIAVYSLARHTRDVWGATKALRALRAELPLDIVHAHLAVGVVAARLGLGSSVPIVWTLHNTRMGFPNWAIRLTNRWVDRYVGCAAAVSAAYQPYLRERILTVTNGVDLSALPAVQHRGPISDGRYRLLSVASLRPAKNFPRLVEAVAVAQRLLNGDPPEIELLVVGEGPERPAIEAAVRALGLRDTVHLVGARENVAVFYARADAFVLASDHEGLPLSLIEAMGSGLPCVLTPFSAAREMLVPGVDALIASSFDPEELGALLAGLARSTDLQTGLSIAAARAATRFDIGHAVEGYSRVYASVASATESGAGRQESRPD